jgi:hypothetical protein
MFAEGLRARGIRVYDDAGNVIASHERAADFVEP